MSAMPGVPNGSRSRAYQIDELLIGGGVRVRGEAEGSAARSKAETRWGPEESELGVEISKDDRSSAIL